MIYKGPVIDVDVHNMWRSVTDLLAYLPSRWRDLFVQPDGRINSLIPPFANYASPNGSNKRLTAFPADGTPPGSDYELMRNQLLDPMRIAYGILSFDIGLEQGFTNPHAAIELCKAANNWMVERWLSIDDPRLVGAILIPTESPEAAADEIRRLAHNPKIVEVLMTANPIGKPFGHPIYDPIHRAAAETGLTIGIHVGGDITKGHAAAGGVPMTWLEQFATLYQPGAHDLSSFVTHGVFERYQTLHLCLKEYGFTWVPSLLWKLDDSFEILKRESPWVSVLPSETVRQHVIVSSQPFDYTSDSAQLVELMESFEWMQDILCFATDYPHWDSDEPDQIAMRLPKAWHDKVFFENSARVYGWKKSSIAQATPSTLPRSAN